MIRIFYVDLGGERFNTDSFDGFYQGDYYLLIEPGSAIPRLTTQLGSRYEAKGYYYDSSKSEPVDFSASVYEDTYVFVDVEQKLAVPVEPVMRTETGLKYGTLHIVTPNGWKELEQFIREGD